MSGLSALFVLSFSVCIESSFQILQSACIIGENQVIVYRVVALAGSMPYLQGEHLDYAIPAVIILCVMLIPAILLFSYPIFNMIITTLRIEESMVVHAFSFIFMYNKLKPFMTYFTSASRTNTTALQGYIFSIAYSYKSPSSSRHLFIYTTQSKLSYSCSWQSMRISNHVPIPTTIKSMPSCSQY